MAHSLRSSREVLVQLLSALTATVVNYHPDVLKTSGTIEGLIDGTACFPGGAGLWRGQMNGGLLPDRFPDQPIMLVGHNFDSVTGYKKSLQNKGETNGQFWQRLLTIIEAAGLAPEDCFFSNALMGVKRGSATGPMPSVPGYKNECRSFLEEQITIVRPRAVVSLGVPASRYTHGVHVRVCSMRHPGDWHFRETVTRMERLRSEGLELATQLS